MVTYFKSICEWKILATSSYLISYPSSCHPTRVMLTLRTWWWRAYELTALWTVALAHSPSTTTSSSPQYTVPTSTKWALAGS